MKKKNRSLYKVSIFFDINNNSISALGRFNKQSLSSVWCKTSLFIILLKLILSEIITITILENKLWTSLYIFSCEKKKCFLGRYTILINYANGRVRPLSMATLKRGAIGPFFSVYLSVNHYDQGLYTGEFDWSDASIWPVFIPYSNVNPRELILIKTLSLKKRQNTRNVFSVNERCYYGALFCFVIMIFSLGTRKNEWKYTKS